jgi:hypothetical protein
LLITLLVVATRKDVAYGLVIIWALLGIAVKQSGNQNIVVLTEISAVLVAVALAASILVSRLRRWWVWKPWAKSTADPCFFTNWLAWFS